MSHPADRPLLVDVSGRDVVRVVVRMRDDTFVGESSVSDGRGQAGAAAEAAAQALHQATPEVVSVEVAWCDVIHAGDANPDILVVLVNVGVAGVPMQYAGAVPVSDDLPTAAARAVLDAVNRRLQIMQP